MTDVPTQSHFRRRQVGYFIPAVRLALEFGFIIALPLIGLGLFGKWLDAKLETGYWLLFGVLFALTLSVVAITIRLRDIRKSLIKDKE